MLMLIRKIPQCQTRQTHVLKPKSVNCKTSLHDTEVQAKAVFVTMLEDWVQIMEWDCSTYELSEVHQRLGQAQVDILPLLQKRLRVRINKKRSFHVLL